MRGCSLVLTLGLAINAMGETVVLTPVEDIEIRQNSANANAGTGQKGNTFVAGGLGANVAFEKRRALLKFDVTSIPSNATISSASLSVVVTTAPPATDRFDGPFHLRKVLQSWTESGATWNSRFNLLSVWQSPGAVGNNDSVPTRSSSVVIAGLGSYIFPNTSNLVGDVKGWLTNPGSNFGWLLKSELEEDWSARHFGSREHPTDPPRLTVTYTIPVVEAPQPTLTNSRVTNNSFTFAFEAVPNFAYQVVFKDSLSQTNWQVLTNILASQNSFTATVMDTLNPSNRFYRVSIPVSTQ